MSTVQTARLYPRPQVIALSAVRHLPPAERIEEIDRITDQLAALGKCRPRGCTALAERWNLARWREVGR